MVMVHRFFKGFFFLFSTIAFLRVQAEENRDFSGKITEETGVFQASGGTLQTYQYSRLLIQNHNDLLEGLSAVLEGEADQQTSSALLEPSWPFQSNSNLVNLGVNNSSGLTNTSYFSA